MSLKIGISVEIVRAKQLGDYCLELVFSDGHVSLVDFGPFLQSSLSPDTRRFLDAKRFRKFSLLHGSLVWGDYDMCFPVADLYEGDIGHTKSTSTVRAVAESRAAYNARKPQRKVAKP
jgi:hypothetical protein